MGGTCQNTSIVVVGLSQKHRLGQWISSGITLSSNDSKGDYKKSVRFRKGLNFPYIFLELFSVIGGLGLFTTFKG